MLSIKNLKSWSPNNKHLLIIDSENIYVCHNLWFRPLSDNSKVLVGPLCVKCARSWIPYILKITNF